MDRGAQSFMTVESPALASPVTELPTVNRKAFELSKAVRAAGYVAVALALTVACVTFFVLMGLTPIAPTPGVVLAAMIVNGSLVAFLIFVVAWEIGGLVLARRRGRAAARLHIRIVALFSVVAATPAILVAIIASVTLDRGLDNWFSTRTRAIVDTSVSIAQAYVDEQVRSFGSDLAGVKTEIEQAREILLQDPDRFQSFLTTLAASRDLPGMFLVKGDGSILASARLGSETEYPNVPMDALGDAKAQPNKPVLIAPGKTNVIGGIVRLADYEDVFLYVLRPIDPKVLGYLSMTTENVSEYRSMEATRFGVQIAFGILYLGISLVVLLSAIWLGISLANRLVSPIRRLIDAAKQVSIGNLAVKVPARGADGDIGALSETFNTMTAQLRGQRSELISASEQIDSRRRFTEAVLAGVTAGVIGIDAEGHITIANRSAIRHLGLAEEGNNNATIGEILPELAPVVAAAIRDDRLEHRDQIQITRLGRERTLNVRVTTERSGGQAHGYVITLDDITDLVAAQRSSAWADVARRIAHEIKNPLTPIQLAAERLKRRFGKAITEGGDVFEQCIDTIVRQVGDIGKMVDEFSSFARMPKPALEIRNLSESIREAVFLLEVSHPDIAFTVDLPEAPLMGRFDGRLMAQALTNVVKNATEAIAAVPTEQRGEARIAVSGRLSDSSIVVDVIDNGIGLPKENRHRLLEPYMTTREKGTGLGLAIVTKIIEDHGGRIDLLDSPEVATGGRGAMIRITLPRSDALSDVAAAESQTTVAAE
jgi:two-component system nitrogen regulation sensor histidine kinase NtrY